MAKLSTKIRKEDVQRVKDFARELMETKNKTLRMMMQQAFVAEMSDKYGHERATQILTKVWMRIEKIQKGEANEED